MLKMVEIKCFESKTDYTLSGVGLRFANMFLFLLGNAKLFHLLFVTGFGWGINR